MNVLKKYTWLVGTLMRAGDKGLTLEQIGDRWNATEELHEEGAFARRSFHRHRSEIMDLFGIEIECYVDSGQYRYRLADDGGREYFRQWMMDSIAVNHVVADSREAAQYILVEPTDSRMLPLLLEALKEQRTLNFTYQPYWSESPYSYSGVQPYALKMFERRWYLIARRDGEYRIFALDRMTKVELQDETYKRDPKFDMEKMFDGTYGIIVKEEIPVESIRLKVDAYQANYLRSLPLHNSQHELKHTEEYSIFSLRVRPTYDFKQKILSLGSTVEVLQPESFRKEIAEELKNTLKQYTCGR
jgi:hypothetical protein